MTSRCFGYFGLHVTLTGHSLKVLRSLIVERRGSVRPALEVFRKPDACVCACVVPCVQPCDPVTPWTVVCQASLSVKFSRQEYWNGLPFPSPGLEPMHWQVDSLLLHHLGSLESLRSV